MIPKKIHYCWFGKNQLPKLAQECIESWKKYCPDYEIIQWNENNYDVNKFIYMKEAYEAKKWAFVSDCARLDIIYNYGGIYIDIDVELLTNLDNLLNNSCFLATEENGIINTGIGFGAEKCNNIIKLLLNEYQNLHFKISDKLFDTIPCPKRNTHALLPKGLKTVNAIQKIENAIIFPPEYFCPYNYNTKQMHITKNTIAIHHFNGSWISNEDKKAKKELDEYKKNHNAIQIFAWKVKKEYQVQYNNFNPLLFLKFIIDKIRWKIRRKTLR